MANFDVGYAVYGALHNGDPNFAEGFNVTSQLSSVLNAPGSTGIVQCGNNIFGDPSFQYQKHFGALVNNRYFACAEGQTIDFNHGGGPPTGSATPTSDLVVKFAVYGALGYDDLSYGHAFDVTAGLQAALNDNGSVVLCGNALFGDPNYNNTKHFAAVVNRGGTDFYFACQEGQTINFAKGGTGNDG